MSKTNLSSQFTNQHSGQRPARTGLGCALSLAVLLLVGIALFIAGTPRLLAWLNNPTGRIQTALADHPRHTELVAWRNQEAAKLQQTEWLDQAAGIARIPIDQAMTLLVEQGLPVGEMGAPSAPATDNSAAMQGMVAITFQADVLPIMVDRCAECHGDDDPEEGLVLTSYADILAGSFYGSVVKPGDPDGSYLVEQIVSGQMPKRGDPLTQAQIDVIIAWIAGGAPETEAVTAELAVAAPISNTTPLTDTATMTETANSRSSLPGAPIDPATVSFQNDVLPVFLDRCSECHGDDNPEEGLELTSHVKVMAGSLYGSVVKPGDVEGSYLAEQIISGQMPKRGDPLTQTEIDLILAWITAGAPDN